MLNFYQLLDFPELRCGEVASSLPFCSYLAVPFQGPSSALLALCPAAALPHSRLEGTAFLPCLGTHIVSTHWLSTCVSGPVSGLGIWQ